MSRIAQLTHITSNGDKYEFVAAVICGQEKDHQGFRFTNLPDAKKHRAQFTKVLKERGFKVYQCKTIDMKLHATH